MLNNEQQTPNKISFTHVVRPNIFGIELELATLDLNLILSIL